MENLGSVLNSPENVYTSAYSNSEDVTMNSVQHLPVGKRFTFRILVTTLVGLALTLAAIGYTLLLSWQLEGGAAAINEAGSLRVRSFRLAVVLEHVSQTTAGEELADSIARYPTCRKAMPNVLYFCPPQRPFALKCAWCKMIGCSACKFLPGKRCRKQMW